MDFLIWNRIGAVIVSLFPLSAVNRGLEPMLGHTLFNANSAIFQLYYGENIVRWDDNDVCFVLDQHA
jgi:hypothetical protein